MEIIYRLIFLFALASGNKLEEAIFERILIENVTNNFVHPIRVTPAPLHKPDFHVDEYGRISDVKDKHLPDEELTTSTSFNCKYHDPCAHRYHANRTYYPSYRPSIFILCYKYDFCIELACPIKYLWNSTTGECKRIDDDQEAPSYEIDEKTYLQHASKRPHYDMTPYDCKRKYPCNHDTFFSTMAVFRHVDADKFIFCNFWACDIYSCPTEMLWYQDLHKCLIPIDYERYKIEFGVSEEIDNRTEYLSLLRTGSSENFDMFETTIETSGNPAPTKILLKEITTSSTTSKRPVSIVTSPYNQPITKSKTSLWFMYFLKKEFDKEKSELENKLSKLRSSDI